MPRPHLTRIFGRRATAASVVAASLLLSACISPGSAGGTKTVAMIPNYQRGGSAPAQLAGYTAPANVVSVSLGETDPNTMFIHMSQAVVPQGPVSFIVTNTGTQTHEFVALAAKTGAADFPVVSFEGETNRIDEGAKGVVNVGETGDMKPGTSMVMTIDMKAGHYAMVCNLPGHYANGMHEDFWVTPPAV